MMTKFLFALTLAFVSSQAFAIKESRKPKKGIINIEIVGTAPGNRYFYVDRDGAVRLKAGEEWSAGFWRPRLYFISSQGEYLDTLGNPSGIDLNAFYRFASSSRVDCPVPVQIKFNAKEKTFDLKGYSLPDCLLE